MTRVSRVEVAVALAPVACALFLVLYAVAAAQDPEYTFLEDYLSDLGVGPGAWAFNSALMISGVMLTTFAVLGLAPSFPPGRYARAGCALLALSGVLLANVGIFTEDAGNVHLYLSYAFFATVFGALCFLAAAMYWGMPLGVLAFHVTSGIVFAGILMTTVIGVNPLMETLAVMMVLAWGMVLPATILLKLDYR